MNDNKMAPSVLLTSEDDDPLRIALDPDYVLPRRIAALANRWPERVFLTDTGGGSVNFAELNERMERTSSYLQQLGLQPGERILSFLPASIDTVTLWLGASCAGLWEIPANPQLRGTFLKHVIDDSRARYCFVRPEQTEIADACQSSGLTTITVERGASCMLDAPAVPIEHYPVPEDVCTVIYTSGTTGPAKGVVITWAQMSSTIGRVPRTWLSQNDVIYSPWPMFHIAGKTPFVSMADIGGRVVLREKPSVGEFWNDIAEQGCTSTTIATLMPLLLGAPADAKDRNNTLRICMGSASGKQNLECQERFGLRMVLCYGSTEVGFPIANRHLDIETMNYVGWLRPGYEARIVDDKGRAVADGFAGELYIRPPAPALMMQGYLDKPEATAKVVVDGWYRTGDICLREANGAFRFIDRKSDTIRRFGENISATALEGTINEDPLVMECCVVGVASAIAGQEILVLVVPATAGLSPAQLHGRLESRLPRYMHPAYIKMVESFPKTPSGKIRKAALGDIATVDGAWVGPAAAERHRRDN